jgi:hypothetical protein
MKNGGVAELVEGGGLEKLNRSLAILLKIRLIPAVRSIANGEFRFAQILAWLKSHIV